MTTREFRREVRKMVISAGNHLSDVFDETGSTLRTEIAMNQLRNDYTQYILQQCPYRQHQLFIDCQQYGSSSAEVAWNFNSLDGIDNFAAGVPEYATALSVSRKKRKVAASIFFPESKELFYIDPELGLRKNNTYIDIKSGDNNRLAISPSLLKNPSWGVTDSQVPWDFTLTIPLRGVALCLQGNVDGVISHRWPACSKQTVEVFAEMLPRNFLATRVQVGAEFFNFFGKPETAQKLIHNHLFPGLSNEPGRFHDTMPPSAAV